MRLFGQSRSVLTALGFRVETIPGKSYVIEFKNPLDDPVWQILPGDRSAKTITNSASSTLQRFRLSVE